MAGKPRPSPAVVVENLDDVKRPHYGFRRCEEVCPLCPSNLRGECLPLDHDDARLQRKKLRGASLGGLPARDPSRTTRLPPTKRHWRVAAMNGDALAAANAAFAAVAAERDRLVVERDGPAAAAAGRLAFRAPSPVVEVSPAKPFVFGATAAKGTRRHAGNALGQTRLWAQAPRDRRRLVFGANRTCSVL